MHYNGQHLCIQHRQDLEQRGHSSAALQLQSLFLGETFSRKSRWLFYSFAKIRSQV